MNALDAVPAGGHVLLETHVSAEDAVLAVSDDGPGIPRENMDKVFAPFFTTKKGGQGTGLGLAVCHGIVSAHGGSIRIESEEGRGTRVVVTLPRKRPRADEGGPRK
jgi:signal transduction histidine kinase